jgi:hypothetical protein
MISLVSIEVAILQTIFIWGKGKGFGSGRIFEENFSDGVAASYLCIFECQRCKKK